MLSWKRLIVRRAALLGPAIAGASLIIPGFQHPSVVPPRSVVLATMPVGSFPVRIPAVDSFWGDVYTPAAGTTTDGGASP
jgi:hypothetical protein